MQISRAENGNATKQKLSATTNSKALVTPSAFNVRRAASLLSVLCSSFYSPTAFQHRRRPFRFLTQPSWQRASFFTIGREICPNLYLTHFTASTAFS